MPRPQHVEAALTVGAQRYLTKPVSVGELLALLDEQLDDSDTIIGYVHERSSNSERYLKWH